MNADALKPDRTPPRRFWLLRHHDVYGVGESKIVAEGTVWSSGQVALHWPGQPMATSLWASLDDLLAEHGHDDRATIEWIDDGCHSERAECVEYYDGAIWIH